MLYELAHREGLTASDLVARPGPRRRLPEPPAARLPEAGLHRAAGPRPATAAARCSSCGRPDGARSRRSRSARGPRRPRCSPPSPPPTRRCSRRRSPPSERLLGGAAPRGRRRRRWSCAACSRATPAGSSTATACSTRGSGATTSASRRWSARILSDFVLRFDATRRALLRRGGPRLVRGLRPARPADAHGGAAARAPRRALGARHGRRPAPRRGVRALRARGRLPPDHALDPPRRCARRATSTREAGFRCVGASGATASDRTSWTRPGSSTSCRRPPGSARGRRDRQARRCRRAERSAGPVAAHLSLRPCC